MGKIVGFLIGVGVTAAIAGGVLFAVGFAANEKEKKEGVDTKEYVATESFEDIDVDLICSNLKIENRGRYFNICLAHELNIRISDRQTAFVLDLSRVRPAVMSS